MYVLVFDVNLQIITVGFICVFDLTIKPNHLIIYIKIKNDPIYLLG